MSTVSVTKQSISLEAAERALVAAKAKAAELKIPMTIAIADEAGTLKSFARMEGASLLSVQVAIDKAYTSAISGFDTEGFFDFIKGDAPLLAGVPNLPRVMVFGGGVSLTSGGATIGGIGVSGGHWSDDVKVAQAGAAALGQ